MKKSQFIKEIARRSEEPAGKTDGIIKNFVSILVENLKKGEVISLSGLGSFRVKSRKARPARNLKTNEVISVPAGKKVYFRPTKLLKKAIQ
ncbi:MAG: HU family DNA-binding protein [Endomicrobiia bacterium]|nr:HU family DNA-binding protein [Endomicrobiia bacterium]